MPQFPYFLSTTPVEVELADIVANCFGWIIACGVARKVEEGAPQSWVNQLRGNSLVTIKMSRSRVHFIGLGCELEALDGFGEGSKGGSGELKIHVIQQQKSSSILFDFFLSPKTLQCVWCHIP